MTICRDEDPLSWAFFPSAAMGGAVEKVWFALAQEFARLGHE
jgi:hypothetical protein